MARSPVLAVLGACALMLGACGGDRADRRTTPTPTPVSTPARDVTEPRSHTPDLTAARGDATYCVGRFNRASEQPAVAAFNAAHRGDGLHARFRQLPGPADAQRRRLATLLGRGCDVAHVDITWLAELAYAGLVGDVTDYVRAREPEFMRAPLDAVRWERSYWGVPRSADAGLLFYETGSGPPETWQDLYELARDNDGLVYQGAAYETLTVHFLELAYGAGATVLSADGEHSKLDSLESLRALELMIEGIEDEAVLPEVLRYTEEDARLAFADGLATYMRNWSYAAELLREPDPESGYVAGDFDYIELPAFEGGEAASVLAGFAVVVADKPRDRDAALALADYLTRPKAVRKAARGARMAPALSDSWDDPLVTGPLAVWPELERSIEQARPRPVTPAYPLVSRAIQRNVHAALTGRLSPEEALRRADEQIERALAKVRMARGEAS
jgi:multiple sugar transport system substrate-binding protein